jgi:hypothetical protein
MLMAPSIALRSTEPRERTPLCLFRPPFVRVRMTPPGFRERLRVFQNTVVLGTGRASRCDCPNTSSELGAVRKIDRFGRSAFRTGVCKIQTSDECNDCHIAGNLQLRSEALRSKWIDRATSYENRMPFRYLSRVLSRFCGG